MESHPRRCLRWSGRWKGKSLVRVQCIWRFRYGPPTHLKGLHRTVCINHSFISDLCFDFAASVQSNHVSSNTLILASAHIHIRMLVPSTSLAFFLQLILIIFLGSVLHGSLDGLRTLKEGSKKVFRWVWMMNLTDGRSTPMDVTSECLVHPSILSMITFFDNPFLFNFA